MKELKILLIGCGKMGSSLLKGIVKSEKFESIIDVIEPNLKDFSKEDIKEKKVNFYSDIREKKRHYKLQSYYCSDKTKYMCRNL